MHFNFIARPGNNQQGDLYNGFLFNRNRQLHVPSEMPNFQSAAGFFYPTDYGTIYELFNFAFRAETSEVWIIDCGKMFSVWPQAPR